jgi:hypothetical protein
MVTILLGTADAFTISITVVNDPFNKTDPTGLCVEDPCIGEAIFIENGIPYRWWLKTYEAASSLAAAVMNWAKRAIFRQLKRY